MLARIEWKRDDKKVLGQISQDQGFLFRGALVHGAPQIVKSGDVIIQKMILTHESRTARKYAGRVELYDCRALGSTEPWWVAVPSLEHSVYIHGNERQPYFIRPVTLSQGRSVEEVLQQDGQIPSAEFANNSDAEKITRRFIMEGILAYQRYRKRMH